MDLAAIQKQITQNREAMGQRYAPEARLANENRIRETIFGNDAQLNSLRDNEAAKVRELYEFDKGLVSASKQHGEPAGFVDDPSSALRYTAEKSQARAGELADIQKGVANRQDVLGNALENALKAINYGLEMEALKTKGLEDDFNRGVMLEELGLKRAAKKSEGNAAKDKLSQEETTAAIDALTEEIRLAIKAGDNPREKVWTWIHNNEPTLKARGIDAAVLWDIYDKLPDNKAVSASPSNGNPLPNMFPYLEHRGIAPDPYKLEIPELPSQQKFDLPKFLTDTPTKSASASRVLKK